tara:strand:- start:314 stop:472 length:159 start_codon:yes stop_codon:yes gene_type:complete
MGEMGCGIWEEWGVSERKKGTCWAVERLLMDASHGDFKDALVHFLWEYLEHE